MKLISLQIGRARTTGTPGAADPAKRPWVSGIWKSPHAGALWADREGLTGDEQADRRVHGGPDKAINVYPSEHFSHWQTTLGLASAPGAFGENFTTRGLLESDVCIGDIYRIGEALVQVSQPRQPCWKLERRWQAPGLAMAVRNSGRTGWYFRVLEPGNVTAPEPFIRIARLHPRWSIAAANRLYYARPRDPAAAASLATCPELSESWRTNLTR